MVIRHLRNAPSAFLNAPASRYSKAYHNFCRMSPADYQELLNLVTPLVSYLDTRLRKAISADERLAVILRYLATGMSTQYRMPPLDWYLQGHVVTTIIRFLQNSTGFQCTRELCSRLVVLVWKCLNGTAPGYLSELCIPVASASGRQHLRSAWTSYHRFPEPEPRSAGGATLSRNHLCGTVFLLLYRDQR